MKYPRFFHNRTFLPVTSALVLITGLLLIFLSMDNPQPDDAYRRAQAANYHVFSPEMPSRVDFAGEMVPLDMYYVRESLDRELHNVTFMHSSTIMMFKRAMRWFPVIEPILKENNIPDDCKFMAVAESNLINVVSSSDAEGFWQFIAPTAKKYGLEINDDVDERYHVEKATQAACDYLNDAYRQFGSWTLAVASFNRGKEGIRKAMEKQKVSSFYDLYLNDETSRYIYRILAYKQVYNHPVNYGLYLRENDFYPSIPIEKLAIDTPVTNLVNFALQNKINYRILKEFNPWLRRMSLPNTEKKTYYIAVPKEGFTSYNRMQKSIPPRINFFHDTIRIDRIRPN